ncbi:MAG TPA: hypothetical protein VIR58_00530 [Acidimicrobiales bacterium]
MINAFHAIVAHQGGWDETLFVLLPVAIFAGLLALANRRATAAASHERVEASDENPESGTEPSSPPNPHRPD